MKFVREQELEKYMRERNKADHRKENEQGRGTRNQL